MARHINKRDLEPVLNAAKAWMTDCLVGDASMFASGKLWVADLVEEATRAFVDHPDTTDDAFMMKLERQMSPCSKGAKQLVAEMLWAMFLFPTNMKPSTKRDQILEAWSWSGDSLEATHRWLGDDVLGGRRSL